MEGPPPEWTPRTDAGARKVVERLDKLQEQHRTYQEQLKAAQSEVHALSDEVERLARIVPNLVTYQWLVPIVGAAFAGVAAVLINLMGPVRDEIKAARKDASDDIRQVRQETAAQGLRTETKVDALYRNTIENAPKAQVKSETQRALNAMPPQPDGGRHHP